MAARAGLFPLLACATTGAMSNLNSLWQVHDVCGIARRENAGLYHEYLDPVF